MNQAPLTTRFARSVSVVPLPGLHLDALGHYLAALGLLRLAAREWPSVHGCWRDGRFVLVNGPSSKDELESFLIEFAKNGSWIPYSISSGKKLKAPWYAAQQKDRGKPPVSSALWRATAAEENVLPLFNSHVSEAGERLQFNPLFGTGGNAGNRTFAEGWRDAQFALQGLLDAEGMRALRALDEFLSGEERTKFEYRKRRSSTTFGWNAGCWFGNANKIYNSSCDTPYREGCLSPWAMLLACEAFPLLAGAPSRRLGTHARFTRSAFPFVTAAAPPKTEQEVGKGLGEFWAPVWSRPLTIAETAVLFQRGKAEIDGRGAVTAPAFAVAIRRRGVDLGLVEFRRFLLLNTTSDNTFESRLGSIIQVAEQSDRLESRAMGIALRVRNQLPAEIKRNGRWVYRGLQGPVDRALVELAEADNREELRGERGLALVDALFAALRRVDRNKHYRKENIRFELLPPAWLSALAPEYERVRELRLAMAIASLRNARLENPTAEMRKRAPSIFFAYRLGVSGAARFWSVPENVPFRRVWSFGMLPENLCAVLQRRLVETPDGALPPFEATVHAPYADLLDWLNGEIDEAALARWLDRCSLFDWSARDLPQFPKRATNEPVHALHSFYAFFRPLFDPVALDAICKPEIAESLKAGPLRPISAMLSQGDVAGAWSLARGAYARLAVPIADFPIWQEFTVERAQRLLAALLIPVRSDQIARTFRRWQSPAQPQTHEQLQPA